MKILFVCVQGLSSAIVVSGLKKQAKKQNVHMDVLAVGIREFEEEIDNGWNLVVIAPQMMHKYDYLNNLSKERNIPCILVDRDTYDPKTTEKLLSTIYQSIV